jgi:hypothetical protein
MITEIGIAAGDIWHYLEQHDGTGTLDEMVAAIGKPRELIAMGLGWLAREGHVTLGNETTSYRAHLSSYR